MSERLERLAASLEEPLLVTAPVNVVYLTGFESSNAALLVERNRTQLFTDFRYAEVARAVPDVEFVQTRRDVYGALGEQLSGRVAFESDDVTYARWQTLAKSGAELVPRQGAVEKLRAVKDAVELDLIREAARITSRAFERLAAGPFVGRSERELADDLERLMREEGADGLAFDIGLGTGPNGAHPHAHPTERTVATGDLVVVDAGARVGGYRADCTRTFAAGRLAGELRDIYDVCLEAQVDAVAAMRAGAAGRAVDAVARERIAKAGYGEAFGHGLGHGVGLVIHEAPTLRAESEATLEPGNVVTVEPGIYLSGKGGVRIEDLVVVTSGEPEVTTTFTKELVTVG